MLLVSRQVDSRPSLRTFQVFLRIREELGRENVGNITGRLGVREAKGLDAALRNHQAVGAHEAEDAQDELEAAAVVVRVQKVDTRRQAAQLHGAGSVLAVLHGDHVLGRIGGSLAGTGLAGLGDLPALLLQRVDVVRRGDELVTLRDERGGLGGEDGGDQSFEVAHGVNDSVRCVGVKG